MFLVLAVAFAASGCTGELSALQPAGPVAHSVARLWWVMAAGAAVLFTLVVGLFLLTMLCPGFGQTVKPRTWIVLGGLFLPIPVLVALLGYSFAQGERLILVGKLMGAPVRIEARARMWQWEFFYLDRPGKPTTVDMLHIPAATPVEVTATSEDVIHSFWIPRVSGKVDAIPGHTPRIRILADAPGTYHGTCAEFCGAGHTNMRFTVRAHQPDDFERVIDELGSDFAGFAGEGAKR